MTSWHQLGDADFLLETLKEGPATTNQILRRSFSLRHVGLTVHSRAADLRSRGYIIECERVPSLRGRRSDYLYRLVSQPSQSGAALPLHGKQEVTEPTDAGREGYDTSFSTGSGAGSPLLPSSAPDRLFDTSTKPEWA